MLLQRLTVALLVAAAALFSVWRLMPLRRRLWLLELLAPHASQGNGVIGALWRSTQAQSGKGCNACVGHAPQRNQTSKRTSAAESPTRTSAGLRR
jgi:hypothetical protein